MELWVIACFGLIAWMNAAVGHGGASGYTALMVLAGFAQVIIRPVALELNLLVSALATWHFFRAGYFRKRLFLSLILLSVPMAYLGSLTVLPDRIYKVLLGC
ncbi:MAG TPA: sulfite exporter TauE/SafE family protein, partial [Bacteroidia bacterium]|nr:sulfite exporter TauE/SafE family protein [Bacteroidia bacterium]